MSLLTKPASLHFRRVRPRYIKAKARNVSSFTFASQAYVWPGERWVFDIEAAPVKNPTNAIACVTFLRDLVKGENYFQINMSAYVPADVPQPMNLRIVGNTADWDVDRAKTFGLSFTLEEDK